MAQNSISSGELAKLARQLEGELFYDDTIRKIYATDASAYREMPLAVAIPKVEKDLFLLIEFAKKNKIALIPRAAGTSLAGQVVGNGIVVDVSKHFNKVLEVNKEEGWAIVQPGVIRDDLNRYLKPYSLYFGPETSTANRAMIGGMVGNNSCGSNSIVYGSTRDKLIDLKVILADGNETLFGPLSNEGFHDKCKGKNVSGKLEQTIYESIWTMLSDKEIAQEITASFPKKSIPRRNTGYALDLLMDSVPFTDTDEPFNFCKLIAGSEGTLAFITEIKVKVDPLPPNKLLLVCAHFNSIHESLLANTIAVQYGPQASELIDHYVIECTRNNIEYRKNSFFIQGEPKAILVVDFSSYSMDEAEKRASEFISNIQKEKLGYHYPKLYGEDTNKIWALRKAGLGLLSNIPGDAKPAPVIEDTAVDVSDLPAYIADFNKILEKHGLYCVHYAHAGSGELHLRPILNLKTEEGTRLFRVIAEEIAALVKKYNGSLSGEHGDGRLRGEFIKYMVGEKVYQLFRGIKYTWDPDGIFNPNKIVDTQPMDKFLRYVPGQETREIKTTLDFSSTRGYLRAAEQCNGSGDCRKSFQAGGTMCPSYMATLNEKDTTRARANILREVLTNSEKSNPFDSEEIKDVLDLCLSCKGCKAECPSNVDMAKLKAEFLQQYYDAHGVPARAKLIAEFTKSSKMATLAPGVYNYFMAQPVISKLIKKTVGFAPERSMPLLYKTTLKKWYEKNKSQNFGEEKLASLGKIFLFCDEFTNFNDVEIGISCIKFLTRLGYEVEIPEHIESGRTYLSKGLVKKAKAIVQRNIALLSKVVTSSTPLIGIEPSAILGLRDEYLDLCGPGQKELAQNLASNTYLIDEFIDKEMEAGRIQKKWFSDEPRKIKLHGHCHQKALSSVIHTKRMLSFPGNTTVEVIPSGCCGMAGSFGYEKEHYGLSMQIGGLVLFPSIKKSTSNTLIVAPGTSCRHQIKDGTGVKSYHPIEILYKSLK